MLTYCPICGANDLGKHRCNEATLRHIDAALSKEEVAERAPSLHARLQQGFAMLDEDDPPERLPPECSARR